MLQLKVCGYYYYYYYHHYYYLKSKLCILIVDFMYSYCYYVLFCIFCFHGANWHSSATLTDVYPCFSLSCKASARV